jgi:hypothetical protein
MIKRINSESIRPEMRPAEDCRDTLETCGKKG